MNLKEHHAHVVEGNLESVQGELFGLIEKELKVSTLGNPDFWCNEFETFGVDDARALSVMQSRKALSGEHKVFVVACGAITSEAQNALLKIFEEPTVGTQFFLVIPSAEILLPTLRSRLSGLRLKGVTKEEGIAKEFLQASPSGRIDMVAQILEEKDKAGALELVNGLESLLYKKKKEVGIESLQGLIDARNNLNTRAPSLKLILHHLALTLPILK